MDIQDVAAQVAAEHEVREAIAGFLAVCRFQGRLQEVALNRLRVVAEIAQRRPISTYLQSGSVSLEAVRAWVDQAVSFSAQTTYPTSQDVGEQVKKIGLYAVRADGVFYCCGCHSLWLAEALTEFDVRLERERASASGALLRCSLCGKLL